MTLNCRLNFERQFLYGLLWCGTSTISIMCILRTFATMYGSMAAYRERTLGATVTYLKSHSYGTILARRAPARARAVIALITDAAFSFSLLFTAWRPSAWATPVRMLGGAVAWLLLAVTFNMYFLLPSYFLMHVPMMAGAATCLIPVLTSISGATGMGGSTSEEGEGEEGGR